MTFPSLFFDSLWPYVINGILAQDKYFFVVLQAYNNKLLLSVHALMFFCFFFFGHEKNQIESFSLLL
jgi:hypothetical protein